MAKIYDYKVVEDYISKIDMWESTEIIEGVLVDTYIIFHPNNVVEVFEETYLNCWSSGLTRHIYKNGLPKKWAVALEEEYKRIEA